MLCYFIFLSFSFLLFTFLQCRIKNQSRWEVNRFRRSVLSLVSKKIMCRHRLPWISGNLFLPWPSLSIWIVKDKINNWKSKKLARHKCWSLEIELFWLICLMLIAWPKMISKCLWANYVKKFGQFLSTLFRISSSAFSTLKFMLLSRF